MGWIAPVFDRTAANVRYGDPKGALTATVLNRVEGNVDFLEKAFDEAHLPHEPIARQSDNWVRANYFRLENFNTIKANIEGLKKSDLFWTSTPSLSASIFGAGITWQEMNDIEKILYDIHQAWLGLNKRTRVAGQFAAGGNTTRQFIRSSWPIATVGSAQVGIGKTTY